MADAKTEKQKVKEITDKLEEGLKELFESGKYKNYLSTMSKFHNYSVNNTLLIALQRPDASLVAGYQAWQKNFNRHVNKGEKGIRILAPAPYKIKEERDKLDPVTGEIMLDQDGMPQTEEVEIKIPAFRAVSVFDVKQTSGEPIPEAQLLHGDTDQYGIYQLKDNPELRDFHFAGTEELLKRGILSDDFGEIQPGNYNLVYAGELSDIHGQSQREKLNAVFEKFNIDHPADYKGHSLSVSDVVVLHENGENSAHFIDSFGFTRLPEFMRALEGVKGQDTQKAEPEERQETSGHDVQKPEAGQTEQKTYA